MFFLLALWTAGCGPLTASGRATQTAQMGRVQALGTQMAYSARSTTAAETLQIKQTAQAQAVLLANAAAWPVIFLDRFDQDLYGWTVGDEDEAEFAFLTRRIELGKYTWQATAYDGFVWWTRPDGPTLSDFYLTVRAQQVEGAENGEYGLVFRQFDDENYYVFDVNARNEFSVYRYGPEGWTALLDWQYSDAFTSGEEVRLGVIGRGAEFTFVIGGEAVTSVYDETIPEGQAGVLVGLSLPGEEASWTFDDFELRAPTAP
ncbi:MAG: hypothetical protein L0Z70_10140 [Chloroflexi bacterium]|nr:hypothetical protein [Chloroflexota bacterium]